MNIDFKISKLTLQREDKEQTAEIYVSMMFMMRARLASNSASSEKKIIKCRKYAYEQLKEFIELIINMVPVKEAATKVGIILGPAYRYKKQ
ncbi:hypothetical protein G6F37_001359 [Rhizopus arrhizus]|nr:hypothetical protein G6F38_012892 [Rhizopus arrhizus]KAG1163265.1 hypothetical protein G6F37_001359 [Rhizopus arrhizus]